MGVQMRGLAGVFAFLFNYCIYAGLTPSLTPSSVA